MTAVYGVTRAEAESLLAAMVAIPSVNPALVRPTDPTEWAGEGSMARFVADWLVRNGIEAALDEVEPGRPNVVATRWPIGALAIAGLPPIRASEQ